MRGCKKKGPGTLIVLFLFFFQIPAESFQVSFVLMVPPIVILTAPRSSWTPVEALEMPLNGSTVVIEDVCHALDDADYNLPLHIASIFIVLAVALTGTAIPVCSVLR